MRRRFLLVFSFGMLLSACSIPMTPNAYREAAKNGNALSMFESFEVDRPLAEVAATFEARAAECLDYRLGTTQRPVIGFGSSTHYYAETKQTVKKSPNKVELYFQVKYENTITEEPEGGTYHLVADAYPVGKKTRVDIYRRTKTDLLGEAIKGWATGNNLGCPDPAQYL
mgnify:CR=1 FL=1